MLMLSQIHPLIEETCYDRESSWPGRYDRRDRCRSRPLRRACAQPSGHPRSAAVLAGHGYCTYLPNPKKIPAGVWPVQLVKSLPPGEGGFHSDKHKQPYSKVIASKTDPTWTIDASHEILEMLVDPYGNRMQSSVAIEIVKGKIQDGTGQFGYLVEACDPCEDNSYAYTINGVAVSDFITPHYYDPLVTPGTRYSFTGAIKGPRQILPGGYISWVNTEKDEWQQLMYVDPRSRRPSRTLAKPTAARACANGSTASNKQGR